MATPETGIFDKKNFNANVFADFMRERIADPVKTELVKSKAIKNRPDLVNAMAEQGGGNYITTVMKGILDGDALNYDGETSLTGEATDTFAQGRVVIGRMKKWQEKDFSRDLTSYPDIMEDIASQVSTWWDKTKQKDLVAVLTGVFNMADEEGAKFVDAHTADVTLDAPKGGEGKGCIGTTTINTAMQRACGDGMGKFDLVCMHSVVATNLANQNLLEYLKYTDANGVQRDLSLATLNGKLVIIDDSMPVTRVPATYGLTQDSTAKPDKMYFKKIGNYYARVRAVPENPNTAGLYEEKTAEKAVYTTYVLGEGAIEVTDCGATVPYETHRDPDLNGGVDMLYARDRYCYAPYGISFTMKQMAKKSPAVAELKDGRNWELVSTRDAEGAKYIDGKVIPIAQIVSLG